MNVLGIGFYHDDKHDATKQPTDVKMIKNIEGNYIKHLISSKEKLPKYMELFNLIMANQEPLAGGFFIIIINGHFILKISFISLKVIGW